jgi:hypothetical protein
MLAVILEAETIRGTRFLKKASCKLCGQKVFEVGEHPSQAELDRESIGLKAHFDIAHGIIVILESCSDRHCTGEAHHH